MSIEELLAEVEDLLRYDVATIHGALETAVTCETAKDVRVNLEDARVAVGTLAEELDRLLATKPRAKGPRAKGKKP